MEKVGDLIKCGIVEISPDIIKEKTAQHFGVTVQSLVYHTRKRPTVDARHIAIYLVRKYSTLTLTEVAEHFGGRDHTTVIHAVHKIRDLLGNNIKIKDHVRTIEYSLFIGN